MRLWPSPEDASVPSAVEATPAFPLRARGGMFFEAFHTKIPRQPATLLASFLDAPARASSFEDAKDGETEVVEEHDCGYCLATGEKRCCEFQEEGTCTNCCKEHFSTDLYCRMNCTRMCRRGIFRTWSGGKTDVPVCPVGEPNQAIQSFDLAKMKDKFLNPYLDWKGEKFEKEWLAAHPPSPTEK
ncbi:unnamed protein product [Symbiodinium natans]|uniref:Uncharacterized protein n=1 Tax=Symbiodinium natans TaxID=878477 RepID=A0A812SS99_9DINO|nr:unnamed protein product [Symbiodinium natans]